MKCNTMYSKIPNLKSQKEMFPSVPNYVYGRKLCFKFYNNALPFI